MILTVTKFASPRTWPRKPRLVSDQQRNPLKSERPHGCSRVFAARDNVAWLTGIILAAGMALGGWIGAGVAVKKGERAIRVILYITLIAMAARLLFW